MDIKVRGCLLEGETLDNCSNLRLYYLKELRNVDTIEYKTIGRVSFDADGCNLKYQNTKQNLELMLDNGLYKILGTLRGLEDNGFGEIELKNPNLLPNAINYVKEHNIAIEDYRQRRR